MDTLEMLYSMDSLSFGEGRGEATATDAKRVAFFWILFLPALLFAQDTTINNAYGSLAFSNVRAYGMRVNFSSSVPNTDGFLFLRARQVIDANFLNQNLHQTLPQKGSSVSFAKVFQSAAPTLFNVREVVENTDYYFALVPYRTNGSNTAFIKDSSTFAHVRSAGADPGNYYAGLNFNSATILTDLTDLLQNHTVIDYLDYKSTMVQNIFERDTTGGQHVVNCEYSNETKIYSGAFDFVAEDYSREHLLPRSWFPTGDVIETTEGSDYHNLALTNQSDVNALRSNFPYGEVVQQTVSYLECRKGKDANQNTVFEPRDEKKGDAARAQFYQILCYNGNSGSWGYNHLLSYGTQQNIQVLRNWHFNDPPDAAEKAKHEYVANLQGNRNPFIDYPDLVDCIDFSEILKNGTCPAVGIHNAQQEIAVTIFPNPATDVFYISLEKPEAASSFSLCDLAGRVLCEKEFSVNESTINISLSAISSGFYLGMFTLKNGNTFCKKVEVVRP